MAENSSGFIDFNTYSDANADEETRLMEEAYQRARQADEAARVALGRASQDASARYGRDGQLQDGMELSKAASYSDYLKAADEAKKQWASVMRDGADPRLAGLRSGIRSSMGVEDKAAASASGLRDMEGRISGRLAAQGDDIARERAERTAAAEAKRLAGEERAESDRKAREEYARQMGEKARGRAAAGGAQLNFVGGFNPYADSLWAQQQGGWEAQQIKNAGGTQAQQDEAWNAYTAKGRYGGELTKQHMQRSMTPYAPPKPDEED